MAVFVDASVGRLMSSKRWAVIVLRSLTRWAYRRVMFMLECRRKSRTSFRFAPLVSKSVAA